MKRLLVPLLVFAGVLLLRHPAEASCAANYPNIFVNNVSVVDANTLMADLNDVRSCATTVDKTQIGVLGINASQVIPTTTLQATFGGTVGYVFSPGQAVVVPLTIQGATSQSGDLLDVCTTSCGTAKYVWIGSGGVLNTNATPVFGGPVAVSSGGTGSSSFTSSTCLRYNGTAIVSAANDCLSGTASLPIVISGTNVTCPTCAVTNANNNFSATQTATNYNVGSGGTYGYNGVNIIAPTAFNTKIFPVSSGGSTYFESFAGLDNAHFLDAGGLVLDRGGYSAGATTTSTVGLSQGSSNGSTVSYHPPVYTSAGAITASTLHGVVGTCAFTSATSCTVTFSGAALWASTTSYNCQAQGPSSSVYALPANATTSGITFFFYSQSGTGAATVTGTIGYSCFGT